ncbi:MAG: hypothetical protein E6J74_15080 [Deltaproteobacteria bacterium]|nr:MAG: hypothetical protein E6J74_15080 [Deltaproteobacteria bacterium]
MLKTSGGALFANGRARFLDEDSTAQEGTAKIFVKIEPADLGFSILAQLDTGSPWSILRSDVAAEIDFLDDLDQPITLHTRFGYIQGQLKRTTITILADDGDSLNIEATVFVSTQWQGGNFLGYSGLLERIRFAVAPEENTFYFGPCF